MYTDLMIDLETLGVTAGSVITQIGLCAYNVARPAEIPGEEMSLGDIRVDIDSCLEAGLHIDGSTLRYWLGESDAARREMASEENTLPLAVALLAMTEFVNRNFMIDGETRSLERVWGYGPSFDVAMLDVAARQVGLELPWRHNKVRCVRTLKELYPEAHRPDPRIAHVGVEDARAQAIWTQNMWARHLKMERVDDGS